MSGRRAKEPEILEGSPPGPEERRWLEHLGQLERSQLDFLDEAGKRIVELSSGLLGLLFATLAFSRDFPPPYLVDNRLAKGLAVSVLLLFLGAILMGMRTVQPRSYALYRQNLTALREELDRVSAYKFRNLRYASWTFFGGCAAMAAFIASIVLG